MADPQSTPTTHYGWAKPAVGASQDVWGVDLNGNLDSQDTTLWNIQAAQSNYLPLTGGTLTGTLNGVNAVFNGSVQWGTVALGTTVALLGANSSNPIVQLASNYYEQLTISSGVRAWFQNGSQSMTLDATSNLSVVGNLTAGAVVAAQGWQGRRGTNVAAVTGQPNNFYWNNAAMECWVGGANVGTIAFTSDYRAKKDVAALPSTWDRVKALNPISFTFKDYTPPIELERDADALPLIVGSDEEQWGFIAHELQETLVPSAASGVKDQADCIQSPNPWTVIATLTRALQEAMARIEALEANR